MMTFFLFFIVDYGINSILFQRGIYPPEDFKLTQVESYGLTVLMSQDNKIKDFLSTTLGQVKGEFGNFLLYSIIKLAFFYSFELNSRLFKINTTKQQLKT